MSDSPRFTLLGKLISVLLVAATLWYGHVRWQSPATTTEPLRVALLQGTYDTLFEYNPRRTRDMFLQYRRLAQRAAAEQPDLDLIMWPESTFTEFTPLLIVDDATKKKVHDPDYAEWQQRFEAKCRYISDLVQRPAVAGEAEETAFGDQGHPLPLSERARATQRHVLDLVDELPDPALLPDDDPAVADLDLRPAEGPGLDRAGRAVVLRAT